MKRFLIRVFTISIIIVVIGIVYELSLRRIPNPYLFKDELMVRKSASVKTLIIGSSVAVYGLFPAYLGDNAYSLAMTGEWIKYNEASLMRFIDKMPHLKSIFWGVCYQALWMDDDYPDLYGPVGMAKFKTEQRIYRGFTLGNHNPFYEVESIQDLPMSFRKWVRHYISHKPTVCCDSLGFDYTNAKQEPMWKQQWKKAIEFNSFDVHSDVCRKVYQLNYERMLRVARLCKERGIRLYLVVPPTHSLYYTHVGTEQLNLMYDALHRLCQVCDNVSCHDYFKDNRFVDDDFHDINHLSDVGAKKFTLILSHDICWRN